MLSCILAGYAACHWLGRRRPFTELVHSITTPTVVFFFLTTGCAMDFGAVIRSWPVAVSLFGARLLSIRLGCLGAALTNDDARAPEAARARYAWLAYLTQAGVGLGLAEEA
jgi:Kef-type K+ transport system membrane component KefB